MFTLRTGGALALTLALLSGCAAFKLAGMRLQPRDAFQPIVSDARVRYLPGSENMAARMAQALPAAMRAVEQAYGAAFLSPPKVYVCKSECFTRFAPFSASVPAAHFADSVFMNEEVLIARETQYAMPAEKFLTHELGHLLLYQHLGALGYMQIPAWFREGFAVMISGGAGAERAKPSEAAKAIHAKKSFDPAEMGSVFHNKLSDAYGLHSAVFYRQAGMFVEFLRDTEPAAFQRAIRLLLQGQNLQTSFEQAYGLPIERLWPDFEKRMLAMSRE